MLILLGAMKQEVDGVRKRLGLTRGFDCEGWRIFEGEYEGMGLALVETGPGRYRAESAAVFAQLRYPATVLISFGFAGGLNDNVRAGDVVLCQVLHDGAVRGEEAAHRSDDRLISLASGIPLKSSSRVLLGNSVTVDRMVTEPRDKRALDKAFGADVVDMEGYWIADAAIDVPFLAVRAISDPVTQQLPPFDRWIDLEEGWNIGLAASHFLVHPLELATLPALYANVQRAESSLVQIIAGIIQRL